MRLIFRLRSDTADFKTVGNVNDTNIYCQELNQKMNIFMDYLLSASPESYRKNGLTSIKSNADQSSSDQLGADN